MERVNHASEAIRLIDATLLEEELVLESLRQVVGSGRSEEEVEADLYEWRLYGQH